MRISSRNRIVSPKQQELNDAKVQKTKQAEVAKQQKEQQQKNAKILELKKKLEIKKQRIRRMKIENT